MAHTRNGRFMDEPLPSLCDWVAEPTVPSPAGGTVIAACSALTAALAELIARVTQKRVEKAGDKSQIGSTSSAGGSAGAAASLTRLIEEANALRQRLLEYGEGDVYEAARIIQGERAACVRKDVGSPAKIAGTVVKLLRLTDELAAVAPKSVSSDLRVIAHLAHASVYGITEIAEANIQSGGGGDAILMERLQQWRQQADQYRDRIVMHT
jgi:formiminotetrahydrofolate cyclodeaminase